MFTISSSATPSTIKTFHRVGDSGSDVTQTFCSNCGSTLFSQTENEQVKQLRFVKAGTLKAESKDYLSKHQPDMENKVDSGLGWATEVFVKKQ